MRTRDLVRLVNKIVAPIKRRAMLTVMRGFLDSVDDTTTAQTVKVGMLADDAPELERFQNYGFTSVPSGDCDVAVVFVGGNQAHGIVVALEDRANRPTGLNANDVAIYTAKGIRIYLDHGNDVVELGNTPTDFVALSSLVDTRLTDLYNAINNAVIVAQDGGASFKSTLLAALAVASPTWPDSVAAAEVKAK